MLVHSCDCDPAIKKQVAVLFFNDPFTWLKALGLAIIIFGVSLFNIYK